MRPPFPAPTTARNSLRPKPGFLPLFPQATMSRVIAKILGFFQPTQLATATTVNARVTLGLTLGQSGAFVASSLAVHSTENEG